MLLGLIIPAERPLCPLGGFHNDTDYLLTVLVWRTASLSTEAHLYHRS